MNLISLTVGGAIMGILMPGIMTVAISPTIAQVRSNNFAEAEAQAVVFADAANMSYQLPATPANCVLNTDNTEISCSKGSGKYKMTAKRSFLLLDEGGHGLGIYSDDDRDGFDDVTGLPTHYFECYSGWKGMGSVKNNCDLGGRYVIPAYSHLYD